MTPFSSSGRGYVAGAGPQHAPTAGRGVEVDGGIGKVSAEQEAWRGKWLPGLRRRGSNLSLLSAPGGQILRVSRP